MHRFRNPKPTFSTIVYFACSTWTSVGAPIGQSIRSKSPLMSGISRRQAMEEMVGRWGVCRARKRLSTNAPSWLILVECTKERERERERKASMEASSCLH